MKLSQAIETARMGLGSIDPRRAYRPAVVAHDLWLASGLETMLPETVLMCVQRSSAVDLLRERGIETFCLAEHVPAQDVAGKSSADLFEHPRAVEFCRRHGPLAVMTFKPSERFAEAVRKTSGVLVAGRGSRQLTAARSFENKLHFVEVARRIGLPTPRWEVVEGADIDDYPALAKRFGERIVVQGPRGNAGQRTWVVSSQDELGEVRRQERGRSLRLSEFVEGLPFTVNAVAYREGLLSWEEPSRQVTGVPWLTPMKLGSCGNAWGTPELEPHLAAVGQALGALAAELGRAGFSGVFGVDFVLGPGGPVVIETNPRMVASLPVSTQLALAAGRVPLLLEHLILGLGTTEARLVGPSLVGLPGTAALPPTSQVIVHRLDSDARPRRAMSSGVYRIVGGREPELRRPGVWLSDIEAADEALLLVREPGEPVTAGKEFARVYLRGAAAEDTPGLRELVDALRGP